MSASGDRKLTTDPLSTIKKEAQGLSRSRRGMEESASCQECGSASPLLKKASTEALNQKFENDSALHADVNDQRSTTSATISALMANSRRRRQSVQDVPLGTDIDIDATAKKMEEMDLYEFKDSSSPLTDSVGSLRPRLGRWLV